MVLQVSCKVPPSSTEFVPATEITSGNPGHVRKARVILPIYQEFPSLSTEITGFPHKAA